MTPALPALDALLKEVETRAARGGDILSVLGYTEGAKAYTCEQRLAAMLRVAVEGLSCLTQRDSLLEANEAACAVHAARHMKEQATAALARIERMAEGKL